MSSLIKILESDDWIVDYDRERGMYRVSYFEDNHLVNEYWFDCYEETEISDGFPKCLVGDIVWGLSWDTKEPLKYKVSMLQQKADKSWKVRLSPQQGCPGVFDVTLDEFNKNYFQTREEAEGSDKNV